MGFVSYQYPGVSALDVIRLFLPDFLVFSSALTVIILIKCLLPSKALPAYMRQPSRQPGTATNRLSDSQRPNTDEGSSLKEFGVLIAKVCTHLYFINFYIRDFFLVRQFHFDRCMCYCSTISTNRAVFGIGFDDGNSLVIPSAN